MYPELLKIGPITIYSYGLMVGIAFLTGNLLLTSELKRTGRDPVLSSSITMLALIGGIVGAKALYLIENWSYFIQNPLEMTFSSGGLTFFGGFVLAIILVLIYLRKKSISFLTMADLTAPILALGYGIARIGCQLAGDGDYGFPTTLPWGTSYANGTVPPSQAFKNFPEIAQQFPGGIVPDSTLCHPTPIYEFIAGVLIFWFLWSRRKSIHKLGEQFGLFLVLHGLARFMVEFIRLNPRLLFGLSEAQLVSIGFLFWGLYLIFRPQGRVPESVKVSKHKK
ncbi:MAG: prolipoprotein diacylglyceryl transferase [Chlorobi bacterium]|nr:prolipoprotein diacylglyceryl transferase [Chlorobiota bacterium]